MDDVARLAPQDRSDLFRAAAEAKDVTIQIIEKDFWVCWVLRHLYAPEAVPADLLLKGGTSLSKVFGVIDRMSEDVDLVIDRHGIGFTGDRDPAAAGITGKERGRRIDALKAAAAELVAGALFKAIRGRFVKVLGASKAWSINANVSDPDNTRILFRYPTQEASPAYLKPMVQLELGARGGTWPAVEGTIRPYAAEQFPGAFSAPTATVRAITAGRTFWEKATLLHGLAHQDAAKVARLMPARHFYDVYRLWEHGLGREAARDFDLLADVVRHKETFYPQANARYDLAKPSTLRLVPGEESIRALQPEYAQMAAEMIIGDAPDFDVVLDTLRAIETEVNGGA